MTEFVLEILDGDRAGEVFELGSEPLVFGRRQSNAIVLKDEKCSGRHAQVELQDGQWVLRDLESTNGTLMDGRKVEEVGLTANDIFQVGVTRVAFKEKGAPTPQPAEMTIKRVDQATLARTRRGGGVGLLLGLVVLLGGAAAYYFFFQGGTVGPSGNRPKKPLLVVGNLVDGGDLEGDEIFATVAGAPFTMASGRASFTGTGYLLAARGEGDDASGPTQTYGVTRTTADITVSAGNVMTATAYFETTGQAKAALRLRFFSTADGQSQVLFTGTVPTTFESYAEATLAAGVPEGCDRVALEFVALLPDDESTVSVDDVAIVSAPGNGAARGAVHKIQTSVGQRFTGCGGALWIDDGERPILRGVRPLSNDPVWQELSGQDLLGLSDVGLDLAVKDAGGHVAVEVKGGAADAGHDVMLRFAADVVGGGVLSRKGDAAFVNHGTKFDLADVDGLLLGYGAARMMVRLPAAGQVTGSVSDRTFELTLRGVRKFDVVYDFGKERDQARQLLDEARRFESEKSYKQMLDQLSELLDRYPHDDRKATEAAVMRNKIRDQLIAEIQGLDAELNEATYFGSLRGYRRIKGSIEKLIETYGRERVLQAKKVVAMQELVRNNIAAIEREQGAAAKAKLDVLAEVYGESKHKELASLIESYVAEYLPKEGAGTKKENDGR